MVNLGIDFGSTYTMVSVFENGMPVTVQPNHLTYNYPSVVAYDERRKRYFFGASARDKLGKPGVIGFRGFKMLLNQQMGDVDLKERNYEDINSPEHIAELFLRHVIDNTLEKLNEDKVGTLVLGAPECWFQSLETVDARGTLRDICLKMSDKIEEVKIISEPTNAAAFCVWSYEKQQGTDFDGEILIVDYGGGTLDTALVSVQHIGEKMQIKPEMRSGAGENKDKEIGKAGIAYQEAVIKKAICEHFEVTPDKIAYNSDFDIAVKSLEDMLVSDKQFVDETFGDYAANPEDLVEEVFTVIRYDNEEVEINFGQMRQAYIETIHPILKKVLDESVRDLPETRMVHVALVGGFCNFCLVKEQIYDYFNIGGLNAHIKNVLQKEEDREKAIAHGAALLSDNVMEVCNVAKFGIGMYIHFGDSNEIFMKYAINYGQEYIPDKIYFAKDDDGRVAPMLLVQLDNFLLNFNKDESKGFPVHPKEEFAARLNCVSHNPIVVVGFSIDPAEKITVHVYNYNMDSDNPGPGDVPVTSIKLSTLKNSFKNTIILK